MTRRMRFGWWLAAALTAVAVAAGVPALAADFQAQLTGSEEVPPRDTKAHGVAVFDLSEDGESMTYRILVANIANVVAAHIHQAPAGVNGPVVVTLFAGGVPGSGPVQGVLAEGGFTAALFSGPLAGQPMSALLADLESGNAYVNVHTNDGVDPTNTGPGDFPGGEIRGQVREVED